MLYAIVFFPIVLVNVIMNKLVCVTFPLLVINNVVTLIASRSWSVEEEGQVKCSVRGRGERTVRTKHETLGDLRTTGRGLGDTGG